MRDFVRGNASFNELEVVLRPHASFSLNGNPKGVHFRSPIGSHVTLTPRDLLPQLNRYLAGTVSEADLATWATVLVMLTEFGPDPSWSDEQADQLEPMWDILEQLGTPEIFQPITPELVHEFVARLDDLQKSLTFGAA